MLFIVIVVAVIVLLAIGAATAKPRDRAAERVERRRRREMDDIIQNDQLEALKRYGTPADAERLRENGIDLEALGYRPPGE